MLLFSLSLSHLDHQLSQGHSSSYPMDMDRLVIPLHPLRRVASNLQVATLAYTRPHCRHLRRIHGGPPRSQLCNACGPPLCLWALRSLPPLPSVHTRWVVKAASSWTRGRHLPPSRVLTSRPHPLLDSNHKRKLDHRPRAPAVPGSVQQSRNPNRLSCVNPLYRNGHLANGLVTKFLSHAVIGGFTTGAAITIAIGQVKYILGYKITMGSSTRLQDYISQYIQGIRNLRWQEMIMGITFIFVLIAFKEGQRLWKPLKHIRSLGALFVCIAGICAVVIGKVNLPPSLISIHCLPRPLSSLQVNLSPSLISIVGFIPSGLPGFTGNLWFPMTSPTFEQLLTPAIVITAGQQSYSAPLQSDSAPLAV
jgi:Sulfate permease family